MREIFDLLEEEFFMTLSQREKMLVSRTINICNTNKVLPKDFYVKTFRKDKSYEGAKKLLEDLKELASKMGVEVEYVQTTHWANANDTYVYSIKGSKRNVKLFWKTIN